MRLCCVVFVHRCVCMRARVNLLSARRGCYVNITSPTKAARANGCVCVCVLVRVCVLACALVCVCECMRACVCTRGEQILLCGGLFTHFFFLSRWISWCDWGIHQLWEAFSCRVLLFSSFFFVIEIITNHECNNPFCDSLVRKIQSTLYPFLRGGMFYTTFWNWVSTEYINIGDIGWISPLNSLFSKISSLVIVFSLAPKLSFLVTILFNPSWIPVVFSSFFLFFFHHVKIIDVCLSLKQTPLKKRRSYT